MPTMTSTVASLQSAALRPTSIVSLSNESPAPMQMRMSGESGTVRYVMHLLYTPANDDEEMREPRLNAHPMKPSKSAMMSGLVMMEIAVSFLESVAPARILSIVAMKVKQKIPFVMSIGMIAKRFLSPTRIETSAQPNIPPSNVVTVSGMYPRMFSANRGLNT